MDLFSSPGKPGFFAVDQHAVGVIALGQEAVGVIAVGQAARGVVAVGQLAVGVVAVGQLAVGALFATGMIGLAGTHGVGLVLHTLPRFFVEKNPEVPSVSPRARFEDGDLTKGCLDAAIGAMGVEVAGEEHDAPLVVDTSAVAAALAEARVKTFDRVVLEVDVEIDPLASGYREAKVARRYVARRAHPYWSLPPKRLAYAKPFGGGGLAPSRAEIALRTCAAFVTFAIVAVAAIGPLVDALFL